MHIHYICIELIGRTSVELTVFKLTTYIYFAPCQEINIDDYLNQNADIALFQSGAFCCSQGRGGGMCKCISMMFYSMS